MRYVAGIIAVLILGCSASFGQSRTFTLSLFYSINEESSEGNFRKIDSLVHTFIAANYSVSIYGYADFLNSDQFNLDLSQKRAELVKSYLLEKKLARLTVLHCKGLGEAASKDNQSAEGEPAQRRVDLVITEDIPVKRIGNGHNKVQEKESVAPEKKVTVKEKKGIEDLEKGESLAIKGLNFVPGRHILVKSAIPVLENLLTTLKEHPTLKVEIQGHICCLNTEEEDGLDFDTHQKNLSESRAAAVYNYLVRNGIHKDRLSYKGYGHSNPKVSPETTPEEEQMNRRVEIKVLEN